MAGIVASTLRRKAFHKRTQDTKYQAIDQGHANVSPTDSRSSSRSSSLSRLENRSAVIKTPKGAQLCHQDFWPRCTNYPHPIVGTTRNFSSATAATATALAAIPLVTARGQVSQSAREDNITNAQFESFDTLVPRANAWLQTNSGTRLVKCETIEKKISSLHDVPSDQVMFVPKTKHAIYLKGLRLWYINSQPSSSQQHSTTTTTQSKKLSFGRPPQQQQQQQPLQLSLQQQIPTQLLQQPLQSVLKSSLHNNTSTCHPPGHPPTEIGYMNVIPRCIDCSHKYPTYENLPETYAAINAYLSNNPLEGKIITIETVPLKLPKKQWSSQDIKPDQTSFNDEFLRHTLYITRIYFCYGPPEVELIGAQDFLPDFEHTFQWKTMYKNRPKYSSISTALTKARDWIQSVRNVAVTNVQTLEAAYRHRPGYVHTGVNFIEKAESTTMVRFVRVTYVRPSDDLVELLHSVYSPPSGLSYKTFIPSPVRVAMCSGSPEYEGFSSMWERAKAWLKSVDRRIVSVETFHHPLHKVWHSQDGAETSVVMGEWTSNKRNNKQRAERKQLVNVVRVYLDGDFQEPAVHLLPPLPMVEEINDCKCSLM